MSILDDDDDGKKSDKSRRSSAPRITDNRTFAQRHPGWHRTLSILDAVSEPFVSGNYYNSQTGGWNSPGAVIRGMIPGASMFDPNRPTLGQNVRNIFGINVRGASDLPPALPISGVNIANGLPPAIPISAVETTPRERPTNNGVNVSDIQRGNGRGQQPALGFAPTIYNPQGIRGQTALTGAAAQDWLRSMQMQRGGPIVPWLRMGTNAS